MSAVRNVIVHKAGKADAAYAKAVQKFPQLNTVEVGRHIQLNGEIVRELQNAALLIANKLVLYVDDEITPAT